MRKLFIIGIVTIIVTAALLASGAFAGGKTTGKKWGAPAGASLHLS
jgi:hypothetical protein